MEQAGDDIRRISQIVFQFKKKLNKVPHAFRRKSTYMLVLGQGVASSKTNLSSFTFPFVVLSIYKPYHKFQDPPIKFLTRKEINRFNNELILLDQSSSQNHTSIISKLPFTTVIIYLLHRANLNPVTNQKYVANEQSRRSVSCQLGGTCREG